MSKTKVHVLVPHTTRAACGVISVYKNAGCRAGVTCEKCKKTPEYKELKP